MISNNKMLILKNRSGITLVALVITIIILLILSSVSVYFLSTNNILDRASNSREVTLKVQALDELRIMLLNPQIDNNGQTTLQNALDYLKSNEETKGVEVIEDSITDTSFHVSYKGFIFEVDSFLNVSLQGESSSDNNINNIPYISDNLVLYLDGINNAGSSHNSAATTWKDLSGNNNDAELKNINNTYNSGWKEKGLQLDGNDDGIYLGNKIKDLFKTSNTIEFCLMFNESNSRDILMGNYTNTYDINYEKYMNNRSRIYFNHFELDTAGKNDAFPVGSVITITYVFRKEKSVIDLYVNGNFFETCTSNLFKDFSYDFLDVWLGRDFRTGSTVTKGTIYSVRMYSDELTNSEIQTNYYTDQERFYEADSDTNFSYIKENLKLYYDGINNAGNYHDYQSSIWKDLSGNNNDAQLKNFSFNSISGWNTNSLAFDGNDDGVYLSNMLKDLFKSDFTFEMYLKCSESQRDILLGNYINSYSISFEQYYNNFRLWWNDGKIDTYVNNVFDTNNSHIAITLDKENQTLKVYKNGNLIGSINNSLLKSYNYNFIDAYIGRDYRTGSTAFKGVMYSIRAYDKCLTQEEITHNYNEDVRRFNS